MKARKVGTDPAMDIAVLQIPAEGLTGVPLGNSEQLKVGDYVVTIGSPFGLDQTATSGIVSGLPGWGSRPMRASFRPTQRSIPVAQAAPWSISEENWSASTPRS